MFISQCQILKLHKKKKEKVTLKELEAAFGVLQTAQVPQHTEC